MTTLLEKTKIKDGATLLTFIGPEGTYEKTERFYLKEAFSNRVFLAYEVNEKTPSEKAWFSATCCGRGALWI